KAIPRRNAGHRAPYRPHCLKFARPPLGFRNLNPLAELRLCEFGRPRGSIIGSVRRIVAAGTAHRLLPRDGGGGFKARPIGERGGAESSLYRHRRAVEGSRKRS